MARNKDEPTFLDSDHRDVSSTQEAIIEEEEDPYMAELSKTMDMVIEEDEQEQVELEQEGNLELTTTNTRSATARDRLKDFFVTLRAHWKQELKDTFFLCWPILISSVCGALLGTTDMAFIGRLGKNELAAAALANAIFFALSFIPVGFLGAQDTLISQSTGMGNERMRRMVVLRSLLVVTLSVVPILVLFMFIEPILLLLGQHKEVAKLTGSFLRLVGIGLWPYCVMRLVSRYLTAQKLVYFPMVASLFSVLLNAGLNYVMIFGVFGIKGLGFIGAPIATTCTRFFIMTSLASYALYIERRRLKEQESSEETSDNNRSSIGVFVHTVKMVLQPRGLWEYMKLGVPASLGLCLEVWGFEVTSVFAGLLANQAYLGAHAILLNICVVTFMLPLSVSVASSIRIGISLGAQQATRAKVASSVGFMICLTIMAANALVLLSTRRVIGRMFTDNEEVLTIVASVIPIGAMFQIFDGAQVALGGILRGTGKQGVGAIANFVSYYLLALPLGIFLCFYFKWQLAGLWYGLFLGLFSVSCLLVLYTIMKVDFEQEVANAQERVRRSDVQKEVETPNSDDDNDKNEELQDYNATEEESDSSHLVTGV